MAGRCGEPYKPTLADRFGWNVQPRGADECWPWLGSVSSTGYGVMKVKGRTTGAHRIALILETGEAPEGALALHSCHNRICVNPAHLRWGSYRDNLHDALRAGRFGRLNPERVREVRRMIGDGMSNRQIAAQMGVGATAIQAIRSGRSWKAVV